MVSGLNSVLGWAVLGGGGVWCLVGRRRVGMGWSLGLLLMWSHGFGGMGFADAREGVGMRCR